MQHRSIIQRHWFLPFLIGLPVAVLTGIHHCLPELREQQYFQFHLYQTGCTLLALEIGRRALFLVGLLALALVAYRLAGRVKGAAGQTLPVVLLLAVLCAPLAAAIVRHVYLFGFYYVGQYAAAVLTHITKFLHNPVSLAILPAILAVGWLCFRVRRQQDAPRRTIAALSRLLTGVAVLLMLVFTGVIVVAGALRIRTVAALRGKPNIIFIMVDTLRADRLGSYGCDLPLTPHLDRLARESTRFEQAVAQSSWTVWSVGSLMTSRFPDRLFPPGTEAGAQGGGLSVDLYYPTLAESLREQGYATNAIISNPWLARSSRGNTQGYEYYADEPAFLNRECTATSPLVTGAALQRLAEIKDRRFFLSLVYMDPHAPYVLNPGFDHGLTANDDRLRALLPDGTPAAQLELRQDYLRRYNAEVAYTDHYIGQLLDGLREQGLYDDALIVVFSDHGEEFLEHGDFGHQRTVYEEVIQVPLLVKFPRQRKGSVVQGAFPLLDLYPSLMAYLGADASALGLQGQQVAFAGLARCADKPIFSSTLGGVHSVRNGGYKYIRADGNTPAEALYRLAADPQERYNILAQRATQRAMLVALLKDRDARILHADIHFQAGIGSRTVRSGDLSLTAERRRQLESLGYLVK